MIKLNMHEAKTHLSRYVNELKPGDKIILCNHNRPVAEILPLKAREPRSLGLCKGMASVPPEFFDPLPDDLLDLFEGKGDEE